MKKILSILLALSVACGSIMLTSCSEDEKEDDDDKSVSDKADKDDEDEDEDDEDEKSDDEDEKSDDEDEKSDDEDEKSDDGDEKSDDEDEKSDEEDESSDEEDESSDEEDESSEDDDDDYDTGDFDYETEWLENFDDITVTAYGTDYEWPFKAEPFLEFFGLDASETLAGGDYDWFYAFDDEDYTIAELDIYNPSADEETAYADCYVEGLDFNADCTDLDIAINGVGIGSTLDDINEAFGVEFTLEDGELCIWDDEYFGNGVEFYLEDGEVVEVYIDCDDGYFFDDEEIITDGDNDDDLVDAEYTAGQTVEFGGISFVVPEGFEGYQSYDDTLDFEAIDESTFSTINIQSTEADDASNYDQEFFDETYSALADSFTPGEFIVSTLGDADTIEYSATMDVSGIEMTIIQYCIFMEDSSAIVSIGLYGDENLDAMEAFIDSITLQ